MADYLTRCSDRVSEDDILRSSATVRHNLNALTEWKKVQIITHIFYNYIFMLKILQSVNEEATLETLSDR